MQVLSYLFNFRSHDAGSVIGIHCKCDVESVEHEPSCKFAFKQKTPAYMAELHAASEKKGCIEDPLWPFELTRGAFLDALHWAMGITRYFLLHLAYFSTHMFTFLLSSLIETFHSFFGNISK